MYVLLELRMLRISSRESRRKLSILAPCGQVEDADFCPPVSVLLPICNESAVVERLIQAVCRLRYPPQVLEVLVLDDSTDTTSDLAQAQVQRFVVQGINIRLLRRKRRRGYKAGNLSFGIRHATGEFFAIFDADFVPPEDFLLRTLPHFRDPELGFLQTAVDFENRDTSFLTRFQAMEMGHQQYVTVGLSADGDMASLSGSSCVWRRACVADLGGWNASTVTEDVDLGYRAQFGNWKYAYLHQVVSMSILPETISAFRVQRERWGRGLIHGAFKHLRLMLQQPMPLRNRLHALATMFSSLLLASIYVLVLLSLPLSLLFDLSDRTIQWVALVFFFLVAVWALGNAFGARKGRMRDGPGLLRTLWEGYLYVALFLPMAWYYFVGGVRALFGVYGGFHRTPKGQDELRQNQDGQTALPGINTALLLGEIFTFAYSLLALLLAYHKGNHFLIPLNFTVCVGFGMALFWSWQEGHRRVRS